VSQRNIDVVRRWIDAYNSRDFDALIDVTDPEFHFRSRFVALESEFRGYEGFPHSYFRTLDEAYERFQVIPSDFIDAGAAVLMVGDAEWRGKASGAEGSLPIFVASWLRTGRLMRTETFTDRAQALEAVGLTE
jgi:ketosteroid isomerase-like protein